MIIVSVAAAVALVAGGLGVYYFTSGKNGATNTASNRPHHDPSSSPSASTGPEQVVSVTPTSGSTGVNGGGQITVTFAKPLSPTSPNPTLRPKYKGTWQSSGKADAFTPFSGFPAGSHVTVTVPGGAAGVRSTGGGTLAASVIDKFTTGSYSNVRMEQLLAQLGYLPLTWASSVGTAPALNNANAQLSAAYNPPQGSYTWQQGYPSELHSFWAPDAPSEILKGAVMAFESDHGLTLDGVIGHGVWKAMFYALAHGEHNTHGYSYAIASQHLPETLTVWHNGRKIFRNLANTGISVRPTAIETDPVYIRYQSQIMRGRNPDGSKYADQVYWVAYFHSGEAVHYFPRASYGWPQSLGCVELPYAAAKRIWPYLTYGTLVTVTAP